MYPPRLEIAHAANASCHDDVSKDVTQTERRIFGMQTSTGTHMKFASARIIAADIKQMVAFYEMVTKRQAQWLAPVFAELVLPGATLAIGAVETVPLWHPGSAEPQSNRTVLLEFQVDDIETEYDRLKDRVTLVHELKTMPWGNRTFQFRDPEGNAVSLFMPETASAKQRFAGR